MWVCGHISSTRPRPHRDFTASVLWVTIDIGACGAAFLRATGVPAVINMLRVGHEVLPIEASWLLAGRLVYIALGQVSADPGLHRRSGLAVLVHAALITTGRSVRPRHCGVLSAEGTRISLPVRQEVDPVERSVADRCKSRRSRRGVWRVEFRSRSRREGDAFPLFSKKTLPQLSEPSRR